MTQEVRVKVGEFIFALDPDRVNLDDFLEATARQGGVVRVNGNPATAIRQIYPPIPDGISGLDWSDRAASWAIATFCVLCILFMVAVVVMAAKGGA